jgi:hypothetical protein
MSFLTQPHDIIQEIQVEGSYKGRSAYVFNILGRRDNTFATAKTVLYDIGEYLTSSENFFNDPSTGVIMTIKSSSTDDDDVGTGVQSVYVSFLDASNNLQNETVTMDGMTPVSLNGGVAINYIEFIESYSVGSGTVSAGNITVQDSATGLIIYEQISTNGNRSLSCRFKIPNGYTGYIVGWTGTSTNQRMDIRLRAQKLTLGDTITNSHHFLDIMYVNKDTSFVQPNIPWFKIPALAEIKSSVLADLVINDPAVTSTIQMFLIAD